MNRCARPECSKLINVTKSHVNIGERTFCSNTCSDAWILQNARFAVVADPMHESERSEARKARTHWHGAAGFAGGRDYGDETQLELPLRPPESNSR